MSLDLRSEPRLPVNIEVVVVLLGNPDLRMQGKLVDLSQSGARLVISSPVSMERWIKVEWAKHFLVGKPRHIKRTAAGYAVGLRVHACSWWHDDLFAGAGQPAGQSFTRPLLVQNRLTPTALSKA